MRWRATKKRTLLCMTSINVGKIIFTFTTEISSVAIYLVRDHYQITSIVFMYQDECITIS